MKFLNQFIFRSPVRPFTWTNGEEVRENNIFLEGLYLSSPALLEEYLKQNETAVSGVFSKLAVSLYKYQARAANRSTPFGLFAGLGTGHWGGKNEIIQEAGNLTRKTRLDMNVVCALAQELARQDNIKPWLMYFPNTSIYRIGDSYRYVEYNYVNGLRRHKINKVDFNEYLCLIFREAAAGLTHRQLCSLLISDEITADEATAFIDELIDAQLLINQFEPNVTGSDYFDNLVGQLKNIANAHPSAELNMVLETLDAAAAAIKTCDEHIVTPISAYKKIHNRLKTILPGLQEANLFQTDLYKNAAHAELDTALQQRISEALQLLNRITPPLPKTNLDAFKKRFLASYEDAEIPLAVALDNETGIGYPDKDSSGINELVDDLFAGVKDEDLLINWNTREANLLRLLNDAKANGSKVVQLTDADFNKVDFSRDAVFPDTISVMFKMLDAVTGKISLNLIGGNSATCFLGRFAGGNETLLHTIKQIADFEQQQHPGKLLAEIVHLPESRTGNILARPVFRNYEIPYLAQSAVDKAFQIDINNLVLKVKNDRIILSDQRSGMEILPCLGNAHHFALNSLPVYHFLCDLRSQYFTKPAMRFHWGVLANQFAFLPRAEYKNVVLRAASWRLAADDLAVFRDKNRSIAEKRVKFAELKTERGLPDRFLIVENDNELLIDCSNPVAIDAFIDVAKNNTELVLEEFLAEASNALIKDAAGNPFANECIAIILNGSEPKPVAVSPAYTQTAASKATFSIGSEWLFYKIYCGPKTADFILTDKIKPVVKSLQEMGAIDKWFFIRYADPDTHLRVRFHICDFAQYGTVIKTVHNCLEPLTEQHIITRFTTDTYKRELARYGDNSIMLAEQLFCNDSNFVTDTLAMLDAESGGTVRWQMALRAVDALLSDFKYSETEKAELITALSVGFFHEHGGQKELKVALDTRFRNLRPEIEEVMNKPDDSEKVYYPLLELLQQRSEANAPVVQVLLEMRDAQLLQVPLNNLLASLLHMNLDRLFMGRNRTNEFVVYDMLARYYKSARARQQKTAPQAASATR